MNATLISGRLTRNAVVNGDEHKALAFTVAAPYGYYRKENRQLVDFVPCVLFDPSDALERLLTTEGKGLHGSTASFRRALGASG